MNFGADYTYTQILKQSLYDSKRTKKKHKLPEICKAFIKTKNYN